MSMKILIKHWYLKKLLHIIFSSRPADTFDYRNNFHYEYDTLEFNHMSVPQLENLLKSRKEHGRVFAGFLLHNIGFSADVEIYICVPAGPKGKSNCNQKVNFELFLNFCPEQLSCPISVILNYLCFCLNIVGQDLQS